MVIFNSYVKLPEGSWFSMLFTASIESIKPAVAGFGHYSSASGTPAWRVHNLPTR